MKKCLVYWSRLMGVHQFFCLVVMLFSIIFPTSMILTAFVGYYLNRNSLVMFSGEKREGNDMLTFSLPTARANLWNSRMWVVTVVYMLYGICLCLRNREDVLLCCLSLFVLLFSHLVCGCCLRKSEWYLLSGMPGLLFGVLLFYCDIEAKWAHVYEILRENRMFLAGFVVLNLLLLGLDIFVWVKEKRMFTRGESYV